MNFPKTSWAKNWVMTCGTIFCSIYGELYNDRFEKLLGAKFDNSVYSCEARSGSCYLPVQELEVVGKVLAQKVVDDLGCAKRWCEEVHDETDSLMVLVRKLDKQDSYSYDDYAAVREALFLHITPNFAVKRAVDYLPADINGKILPDLAKAREYTEPVYPAVEKLFGKMCSWLAEKEKLGKEEAHRILDGEFQAYLREGVLPKRELLQERIGGCVLWYAGNNLNLFVGDEASDVRKILLPKPEKGVIMGTSAFKGNARGIVRVVLDPAKADDFQEGDILVTGMTRPEYLNLMKKAAAFVTDAGGMLSHAAIVARELKKPCVVGTEVASKILKSGDFVEVDADAGLVRKIKEGVKSYSASRK